MENEEKAAGTKLRVLSGIQPSGILHLGNYFGAMKQFLELQEKNELFIFIANYHAMTTIKDRDVLRKNTFDIAAAYMAIGLDTDNVRLFRQSDILEVCELSWILGTLIPMGLLERCHSYKDKVAQGIAADYGLFSYPVLMAADILIYKSDIVPVGKDQKQHVEVARDIALKFNNLYGPVLKIPDIRTQESTAVVPGLDGRKMSKSYNNYISLFESEKVVKKQVMSVVTDSTPLEAPKDPETCNVFALYKLFGSSQEVEQMARQYRQGGYGYGQAKKELLAKILEYFGPARERYRELQKNPDRVESVLKQGARQARELAQQVMQEVRAAVGVSG
jgi:tryptophanyl-tRNA synthetase